MKENISPFCLCTWWIIILVSWWKSYLGLWCVCSTEACGKIKGPWVWMVQGPEKAEWDPGEIALSSLTPIGGVFWLWLLLKAEVTSEAGAVFHPEGTKWSYLEFRCCHNCCWKYLFVAGYPSCLFFNKNVLW